VIRRVLIVAALLAGPSALLAQPYVADVGFVSAAGNTRLTTITANGRFVVKVHSWAFTQQTNYNFGKTDGVASANQLKTGLRGDHTFFKRAGFFASSTYERNRFAGLLRRSDQSGGLTWRVLDFPNDSLKFDSGGVYSEAIHTDSTRQYSPAARGAIAYKHSFGGTSALIQTAEYIPTLKNTGQYRINSETALVAKMVNHFGLRLAYAVKYDNKPADGFRKADRILTTGLQVTY
jgi:putative salt-induced outer membrane protein YdiY